MSRRRAVVVGVLLTALTALATSGCSAEADRPELSTTQSNAAREPDATLPSETGTGVVPNLSDPELGLVIDDVPDLTGDAADVFTTVVLYQREYWRSLTTNETSRLVTTLASPAVVDVTTQFVAGNAAEGVVIDGVFRLRVQDVVVAGDTATATACGDFSDATFVHPDGTATAEQVGLGREVLQVDLSRAADGQWVVEADGVLAGC